MCWLAQQDELLAHILNLKAYIVMNTANIVQKH